MPAGYSSATLLLIRHGQARASDGSYGPDTPLSELGRTQAEKLAHALSSDIPPAVVYTSPFPRALETATPLCKKLSLKPVVDVRLTEFELGTMTLHSAQQSPDLVLWQPDHSGVEGGETLEKFSLRVATFCEEVAENHRGDRVAVFAHAGTIDAAIRWALGLAPTSPWQHEFDLTNASMLVWIEELIELAEASASAPVYPLLKRADERHVTMQSYDNPMFVEDVVRNVAMHLNEDPRISWFHVRVVNQESIHNHSAFAHIEKRKNDAA